MKLAIFSKRRSVLDEGTKQPRTFYTYLTTLVNRTTGEPVTVQVKFREACGAPDPDFCPMFIEVPKDKMNLAWSKYTNNEGDEMEAGTIWVTQWDKAGEYVDHSMDEFDAFGV